MENLLSLREKIDKINFELLSLLNKRLEIALQIQEIKKEKHLPLYDPDRENKMFSQILKQNLGPLSSDDVRKLFQEIFQCTLKYMEDIGSKAKK